MNIPEKNPAEKSDPSPNREFERVGRNYFGKATDLIDHVGELVVAMRNDRQPDISEYSYLFDGDKLDTMYKPDQVTSMQMFYGRLDEVMIFTRLIDEDHSSSITVNFIFVSNDGVVSTLSAQRPGHSMDATVRPTDTLNEDIYSEDPPEERNIKPIIPADELSMCVASLIFPSTTGDWSSFNGMNLNDPTIYEALTDALQKHATGNNGNEYYKLSSPDGLASGRLEFTTDDGQLISAQLQQTLSEGMQIVNGEPVLSEHVSAVEIDLSEGVSIEFSDVYELEHEQQREKNTRPETEHFDSMIRFAKHHIGMHNSSDVARITELTIPPYNPGNDS